MTTTDVAGLPAEIRAVFARAGITQETAYNTAAQASTSYHRRMNDPASFRLGELAKLLAVAGWTLRIELEPAATAIEHERIRREVADRTVPMQSVSDDEDGQL